MVGSSGGIDIDNLGNSIFVIKSTIALLREKYSSELNENIKENLSRIEKAVTKLENEISKGK